MPTFISGGIKITVIKHRESHSSTVTSERTLGVVVEPWIYRKRENPCLVSFEKVKNIYCQENLKTRLKISDATAKTILSFPQLP